MSDIETGVAAILCGHDFANIDDDAREAARDVLAYLASKGVGALPSLGDIAIGLSMGTIVAAKDAEIAELRRKLHALERERIDLLEDRKAAVERTARLDVLLADEIARFFDANARDLAARARITELEAERATTEAERLAMRKERDEALARVRAWETATGETSPRIVKARLEAQK